MGKIKQGILGGFSGKVAGVVGSSWKGIAVIKSKPLSVANPKTAAQVAQREKMSNATAFAKQCLTEVIKPLWDRFASKMSGYNSFVKENIALFATSMPSTAADLVISNGKMGSTPLDTISATAAGTSVTIGWGDDGGEGLKLSTDDPYIVIVNETQEKVFACKHSSPRSGQGSSFTTGWTNAASDVINGYLAFRRTDGTVVSKTSFNTVTVS